METLTGSQQASFSEDEGRGETEAEETEVEKATPVTQSRAAKFYLERPDGRSGPWAPRSRGSHPTQRLLIREHPEAAVLGGGGQTRSSEA